MASTYDPVTGRLITWDGETSVFSLNLDTRAWAKISPASTNTVTPTNPPSQETFGRERYIPSKNVFIVVNSIDQNVLIYKLSAKGTPFRYHPTCTSSSPPNKLASE